MSRVRINCGWTIGMVLAVAAAAPGAEWGLKPGAVSLRSATALTFGPEGILFVGDAQAATVFAIDSGDAAGDPAAVSLQVADLAAEIGKLLQVEAAKVRVNDLAVNPLSGNAYLAVAAGGRPALVRVDAAGTMSSLNLEQVKSSQVVFADAPEDKEVGEGRSRGNRRGQSITDLAYVDGKVIVAGLSNAASPATIREVPFPFAKTASGTQIEIYHGAHGRYEDYAPVRAFVPFNVNDQPVLLAGFTCTPLVSFPVASLQSNDKVRGTTVAELGNRNQPLDMIVYKKDGKDFVLAANTTRGVMKISTENIQRAAGIVEPVRGGGTAGQPYETIKSLEGVVQLDRLNEAHAVIVVQADSRLDLKTVELP